MVTDKKKTGGAGFDALQIFFHGMRAVLPALAILFTGAAHAAEVVDRIVAVVDDELVTLSELTEMMRPYDIKIRQRGYSLEEEMEVRFKVREDLIVQLIDQKIAEKEVRRAKIAISENEVDQAIERVKEANAFTDDKLRVMLEAEGITYEMYRQNVKDRLLRTRLINYQVKSRIVVTDEDIEAYYNGNTKDYQGKKFEDVSDYISQKLFQQKVEEKYTTWLTTLKQKAHIRIIH